MAGLSSLSDSYDDLPDLPAADPVADTGAAAPDEEKRSDLDKVSGTVRRVTFMKKDTGFVIMRLQTDGGTGTIGVKGNLFLTEELREGDIVAAEGKWEVDAKWGRQFVAEAIFPRVPDTSHGIYLWLKDGKIPGIGKKTIDKLEESFGDGIEAMIGDEQALIAGGIPEEKARTLAMAYNAARDDREVQTFIWLRGLGLGPKRVEAVMHHYGENTRQAVRADPWELCRTVEGVGFTLADRIAQSLGVPHDSASRIKAGVLHVVEQNEGRGSCGIDSKTLIKDAAKLLREPAEKIMAQVPQLVEDGLLAVNTVIPERPIIRSARIERAEQDLARIMASAVAARPEDSEVIEEALRITFNHYEHVEKKPLTEEQQQAVRNALTYRLSIITGGPGVGKTFTMGAIVYAKKALARLTGRDFHMIAASPTGMAAMRQGEVMREIGIDDVHPSTIHKAAEWRPDGKGIWRFHRTEQNPLPANEIALDEVSMLGLTDGASVMKAVAWDHAHVLWIGDVDQIPSVPAGRVLADAIASGVIPTTFLTVQKRSDPGISQAAQDVKEGRVPATAIGKSFRWYNIADPEAIRNTVVKMVAEQLPKHDLYIQALRTVDPDTGDIVITRPNVRVASPMYAGVCGINALNHAIKQAVNPIGPDEPFVEWDHIDQRYGTQLLSAGDRVLQVSNMVYEVPLTEEKIQVANGQVGTVVQVTDNGVIVVEFDEGMRIPYGRGDYNKLSMGWCVSQNRMQGQEADTMITVVHEEHRMMLKRELIYTTLTRGKKRSFVIGSQRAFQMAVSTVEGNTRETRLAGMLRACAAQLLKAADVTAENANHAPSEPDDRDEDWDDLDLGADNQAAVAPHIFCSGVG